MTNYMQLKSYLKEVQQNEPVTKTTLANYVAENRGWKTTHLYRCFFHKPWNKDPHKVGPY